MMSPECRIALRLAYVLVGQIPADGMFTVEDVESAFQHLNRCAGCRESFSPEERGRFVRAVIMDRE